MAIIFDGRAFAAKKEELLKSEVKKLKKVGITPTLITILASNDPASRLYVNLKKKAGERVGVNVEIIEFSGKHVADKVIRLIKAMNLDSDVHGIMLQLPVVPSLKDETPYLISLISAVKDVDGMRQDSQYLPAAVSAVGQIIDLGKKELKIKAEPTELKACVIGCKGVVGKSVYKYLTNLGYQTVGFDKNSYEKVRLVSREADVLVTATGEPDIISPDMVKAGSIVIDVGAPKADVFFSLVSKKAGFITPVPGGVGPMTVVSLLENLVKAAYNRPRTHI